MNSYKAQILTNLCYTELVYRRINKKLNLRLSKAETEEMISDLILKTHEVHFVKKGKNIYITNSEKNIRLTINSNTTRIITADLINKITNHKDASEKLS